MGRIRCDAILGWQWGCKNVLEAQRVDEILDLWLDHVRSKHKKYYALCQKNGYSDATLRESARRHVQKVTKKLATKRRQAALPATLKGLSLGTKEVDLTDKGLKALPAEIGALSRLEVLKLRGNPMSSLPDAVTKLARLRQLDLHFTRLRSLPAQLGQLSALEDLDVGGDEYRHASLGELPSSLLQLTRLRRLDLSSNRLKVFPPLPGLRIEELNLRSNHIAHLDGVLALSALRVLNVQYNRIARVPRAIAKLKRLEDLRICRNHFKKFGEIVDALAPLRLKTLYATHMYSSDIARTHGAIGALRSLEVLSLNGNRLGALSPDLGKLAKLRHLDLYGTRLRALPPELAQLRRLEELVLSGTEPKHLDAVIELLSELPKLRVLHLAYCKLEKLPDALASLRSLEELNIEGNSLTQVAACVTSLPRLRSLTAIGNDLSPAAIASCRKRFKGTKLVLRAQDVDD